MDSCVGDNPSETKFCNCSYDYMINKIGISGMMDISIEVLNNKMSEKTIDLMSDAIIYCH